MDWLRPMPGNGNECPRFQQPTTPLERTAINMTPRRIRLLATVAAVCGLAAFTTRTRSDENSTSTKPAVSDAAKSALSELNDLIGGWRGVGQPKRGSTQGAWLESAEWVWDFSSEVALRYKVEKGKLLTGAALTYDPKSQRYRLHAQFAGDAAREYAGQFDDDQRLVLDSQPDDGYEYRVTITRLNAKRTLVLHERRQTDQKFFTRIAEIGYTRQGTSLADAGAGEPQCIVTGGKGTIAVSFESKTYYVCCTGCKQAFDDDPAGIVADYKQRLAEDRRK